MSGSASQQASRCLTKHPPQKLPPPSQTAANSSPLPSPARMSSFSKRHASFGSPREVPIPSPSQNNTNSGQFSYFPPMPRPEPSVLTKSRPTSLSNNITENGFDPVFDEQVDDSDWTNVSKRTSTAELEKIQPPPSSPTASGAQSTSQIHPYPRPYSVPHSHNDTAQPESSSKTYKSPTAVDRTSSTSLPLPAQIPFHLLPEVSSLGGALLTTESVAPSHKTGLGSLLDDVTRSSAEEPKASESRRQSHNLKNDSDDGSEDSGGSLSSVSSTNASRGTSGTNSPLPGATSDSSQNDPTLRPASYPSSQVRDPPQQFGRHTPMPYLPETSLGAATALRRSVTMTANQSHIPPPQPPIILPSPPLPPPNSWSERLASTSSNSSCSTNESLTSASGNTSLTNSNSAPNSIKSPLSRLPQTTMVNEPPYATFLSHAPPPADSWIEVETKPSEYRLNVRLPGFQRDGITLATKKRRILHVVADSWGTGGGHFERRISFGYDADLAQVRAEFDGEMLRVIVPRRMHSILGLGAGMGYAM